MSLLTDVLIKLKLQGLLGITPKPLVYDGENWDLHANGCPDCGTKPFNYYSGPEGPGAVNICCSNPLCRSAFWMAYGPWDGLRRIPNTVFRNSFPECPEESEAYLRTEELKKLNEESETFIKELSHEP